MPRIVTALYRNRSQAEQALQALIEPGIARSHVVAIGFAEDREISSISGFRSLSARDDNLAALDDLGLSGADRRVFEQGLRRGCFLIAAQVSREDLEEAIHVLEMFDPVDLDRESREWSKDVASDRAGADTGMPLGAGVTGGSSEGLTNTSALPEMGSMAEGTDDLGTDDVRIAGTAQPPQGPSTTAGGRRSDERAGREGVTELASPSNPPAQPGLRRDVNRGGRVWAFGSD
jgi:hypothetical protein